MGKLASSMVLGMVDTAELGPAHTGARVPAVSLLFVAAPVV
ncbi:hypothetical protein [Brevibacillus centrosporus]|nr:hypothetical protein [Brevibacillus centrosporus]